MRKAFFKDVELAVLEGVYEPREDSYLLAEAVDVNPKALENARLNFERLKLKAKLVVRESELFEEIP